MRTYVPSAAALDLAVRGLRTEHRTRHAGRGLRAANSIHRLPVFATSHDGGRRRLVGRPEVCLSGESPPEATRAQRCLDQAPRLTPSPAAAARATSPPRATAPERRAGPERPPQASGLRLHSRSTS